MMGKILTVLLALLAPISVQAAPFEDQRGQWWDLSIPPAHYFDRPYKGLLEVFQLSEDRIRSICANAIGTYEGFSGGGSSHGCTFPYAGRCEVYVSSDLPKKFRKAVERHELAHCHGWPADHPEK